MTFIDMLVAAGWSAEQILAMGLFVAALIVVAAIACVAHEERPVARSVDRALDSKPTPASLDELLDGPAEATELPPLPQRVPGKTFDEHAAEVTAQFSPIAEPRALAARVIDMDGVTWTHVSPPALMPGRWASEHGVVLSWDLLRVRHPRQTAAGVTDDPWLQLADDTVPLEDVNVTDADQLALMGSVFADLDDLATFEGGQR